MPGKTFEAAWESLDRSTLSLPGHLLAGGYLENLVFKGFTRREETLKKQITLYNATLEKWWSAHLHVSNFCYGDGDGWGNIKNNPLLWFDSSATIQNWPTIWKTHMSMYLQDVYGHQELSKDPSLSKPHVIQGFTPSLKYASADRQALANIVIPDTTTGHVLFSLLERVAKPAKYPFYLFILTSTKDWPDLPHTEGGESYSGFESRVLTWLNSLQAAWHDIYFLQISNIATTLLLNESAKQRAAKKANRSRWLRW